MRKTILGRRGLSWALAAVMVVALPSTRSLWAVAESPSHALNSQLPAGVTLHHATLGETVDAVHAAVGLHPDMATSIVQVAIMTKSTRYRTTECSSVKRIADAAMSAAKDRSSEILQMALSLAPDCADALNSVVDDQGLNTYNSPTDLYGGFGVGFGPGFPGSPGFTGSPPSGAIALPPVATTDVVGG